MSETKIIVKKWLPIQTSQELSVLQLNKLLLICSSSLALRICKIQDGNVRLELLCGNEKELFEAEAIISQALADERLREQISAKCDTKVSTLIEIILMRALGE